MMWELLVDDYIPILEQAVQHYARAYETDETEHPGVFTVLSFRLALEHYLSKKTRVMQLTVTRLQAEELLRGCRHVQHLESWMWRYTPPSCDIMAVEVASCGS